MKTKPFRPPYMLLLLLMIILCSCFIQGVMMFVRDKGRVNLTETIMYIQDGIIYILGIVSGAIWISSTKSWDLEGFIKRLETSDFCDLVIFLAQQQKEKLKRKEEKYVSKTRGPDKTTTEG